LLPGLADMRAPALLELHAPVKSLLRNVVVIIIGSVGNDIPA
jgi:hypothetical protein